MKITMAQINPVIGDIAGNLKKIEKNIIEAAKEESDLIVFPELALVGYPPRDLLYKKEIISQLNKAIEELLIFSKEFPGQGIIIGTPMETKKPTGKGLYNSALLINKGKIVFQQNKSLLPTYDVFDEHRYFEVADSIDVIKFKGELLGITICEDIWNDAEIWQERQYDLDPVEKLVGKGASLIINISASPFHLGKDKTRYDILDNFSKKYNIPFVYVNQVGCNDELIFDGKSILVMGDGSNAGTLAAFEEDLLTVDLNNKVTVQEYTLYDKAQSIHDALKTGIRDYFDKCGFTQAIVGLSGGIDSAVTVSLAVEALGKDNVLGISMPGPYSSKGSVKDSRELAKNLGIDFKVISISEIYESYLESLKEDFAAMPMDVTEENIQARIRGNILMAFSNKFGHLVLATGNKSELAVGYCTLYGDMSGGMSVLADVPKTMVYELADYINRENVIIPENTIEKPPSAELRPDQKDEDSLPPYEILDEILYYYIDMNMSLKEIVVQGHDEEMVEWIIKMVDRNEYKRRQAAPGLKVTSKAFGMGRRMPVAARY